MSGTNENNNITVQHLDVWEEEFIRWSANTTLFTDSELTISNLCHLSNPCQHFVTFTCPTSGIQTTQLLCAVDIVKLVRDRPNNTEVMKHCDYCHKREVETNKTPRQKKQRGVACTVM